MTECSGDGALRSSDHSFRLWPDTDMRKLHIPGHNGLRVMERCFEAFAPQVLTDA